MIKRAHHQLTMKKFRCISFIGIAGVIITLMILNFANPGDESENGDDKNKIINIILYLFKKKLIDDEDIKHGIVLGLVKFKKNIIDSDNKIPAHILFI